jgi:anti-sigma factor RsiW
MNRLRKQNGTTEHQRIEEQLSAYLDGELSAQERQAVQRHLATCADCRWNLETLKRTVQWTRELPSVPIPRVFTIPVPAQPVRARQRSWSVPLLQGATALVALLLVFAFVGDFALTGLMPARAPEPVVLLERQAVEVVATQPVEVAPTVLMEMQAPALPAESETQAVAEKVAAEAPAPAAADTEAAAEEVTLEQTAPPAPTAEPDARSMGAAGFETPTEAPQAPAGGGETVQEEPVAAPAPEGIGAGEPVSLTYTAEVTSTAAAILSPAAETPLAVAEAKEPVGLTTEDEAQRGGSEVLAQAPYAWLRPTEVVLGVLFILLAATTAVVMVQRRQSR